MLANSCDMVWCLSYVSVQPHLHKQPIPLMWQYHAVSASITFLVIGISFLVTGICGFPSGSGACCCRCWRVSQRRGRVWDVTSVTSCSWTMD
jgi:hypothetical protein